MTADRAIRILAVDDDRHLCELTREFLTLRGEIEVNAVFSVDEAWAALSQGSYDAIVSDYYMPGENGIQFLKALRAGGDMTPFILLTCREREEVVIEALNLGADAYIHKGGKPVPQYVELEHLVREAVIKRRQEVALRQSEARYREMADLLPIGVFELDLDRQLTFLNQRALRIFGYTFQETVGRPFCSMLAPEECNVASTDISECLESRSALESEYSARRKDGSNFQISAIFAAITRDGVVEGVRGVLNDITERKRTEETERIRKFRVAEMER